MTFLTAFAGEPFALVSADTCAYRFDFSGPGEPHIVQRTTMQKVRPLRGGWLVGSGAVRWWPRLLPLMTACPADHVAQISKYLRDHAPSVAADLARLDPAERQFITRAGLLRAIYPRGEGFGAHEWTWWTGDDEDCTGQLCSCVPSGVSEDEVMPLIGVHYERIRNSTLYDAVRATAAIHQLVHALAPREGSVSDAVELGVLRRGREGEVLQLHLAPTPARTLLNASDHTIDALLVSASPPPAALPPADVFASSLKTLKIGTVASPATKTKTLMIGPAELIPMNDTQVFDLSNTYYMDAPAATADFYAAVLLPVGATLTAVDARTYMAAAGGAVTVNLYRIESDAATSVTGDLILSSVASWTTLGSGAISESITAARSYVVKVTLNGNGSSARIQFVTFTYTIPDYAVGI